MGRIVGSLVQSARGKDGNAFVKPLSRNPVESHAGYLATSSASPMRQ